MERRSSLSQEGPPSRVLDILLKLQSLGFCLHLDASTKGGLCLFDQILEVFMVEIDRWEKRPPLPASIISGQSVDLFALYMVVAQKGGFDFVSANRLWPLVAEEIGLVSGNGFSLKSIYFKYLGSLNPLLIRVLDEEERSRMKDANVDAREYDEGFSFLNRKRDPLVRMLKWVLAVAKNPRVPWGGDEALEEGFVVGELMSHLHMCRKAMFLKKNPFLADDESLLQRREKISGSCGEDCTGLDTNTNQRSRCSKRVHSVNSHSHSYLEVPAIPGTVWDKDGADVDSSKRRRKSSSPLDDVANSWPREKKVRLGPAFQVKVPAWPATTSLACDDSESMKWLGSSISPPDRQRSGGVRIGKGREDNCACEFSASVQCFRLHVAEKRCRLKLELGSTYHDWGFDCMGEETARSWTEEEEMRFMDIVRLNPPSLNKNFWDQLTIAFPSKGRGSLVSYYYNVFLLRRRGYQNRVTPDSIDSDDEDRDYGFLRKPSSPIAVRDRKSNFRARNSQLVDLTESSDTD